MHEFVVRTTIPRVARHVFERCKVILIHASDAIDVEVTFDVNSCRPLIEHVVNLMPRREG